MGGQAGLLEPSAGSVLRLDGTDWTVAAVDACFGRVRLELVKFLCVSSTLNNLGNAYRDLRQPDRAAECWREAAAARHDAGDHERAENLEQLAASSQRRSRRRWRLRRGSSS